MNYKEFENSISQKLKSEEIGVDTESLIQAIRKGSKDKRYNYYFGFFGLVALSFISFWIYSLNSNNVGTVQAGVRLNSLELTKAQNQSSIAAATPQSATLNNLAIEENEINKNSIKPNISNIPVSQIIGDDEKVIAPNVGLENNNSKGSAIKESLLNSVQLESSTLKNKSQNISTELLNRKAESVFNESNNNSIGKTSAELKEVHVTLKRSTINIASLKQSDIELIHERTLNFKEIECPDFLTGGVKVSYNIEAGIFFADKALVEKEEENEELYLLRKEKERTLESLNIASSAIIKKENGPFYITAGVSYTRIAEQMKLNHNWTEYDTTVGIISTTTSQTGDTITVVMGDIIKEFNYQRNSIDHYYIHLLDLPFGLGLENHRGNFIYGVDAGVQLNLYTNSTGKFYRKVESHTDLPNENVFRTAIGISYFGSMRMGLKLNYNSSVYLSGKVRFIPGDFAAYNNNISQYYTLYGINAGYRYSF